MTMTATDFTTGTAPIKAQMRAAFARRRMMAAALPVVVLGYLAYIFVVFDVAGLIQRAEMKNAVALFSDSFSYKTHVARDNRSGDVSIAIEGERKGRYPEGRSPDWVTLGETTVIDLGNGHVVRYTADGVVYTVPGYGEISATPTRAKGIQAVLPEGEVPDWINVSRNRLAVATEAGRMSVTRNRTEVMKYHYGWELFFFTLDSPYYGLGLGELTSRALNGEAGAIFNAFWTNKMWHHSQVAWALSETILMAFLGTMGGAIVALPLAFLAARNFTPLGGLRFAARRLFDFVRGVDALIWTIVLSRAFGPGPLTGALAILITDTGSFGKMFSETLENVDDKQIEGIRSTGANPLQRSRFGVIPQITPVLLSQVLYFLESNTRSATVIGAITGGGIGLLLVQAMTTQKDWEEVSYYIILVIIMVMVMDWFSGWLRRILIKGGA